MTQTNRQANNSRGNTSTGSSLGEGCYIPGGNTLTYFSVIVESEGPDKYKHVSFITLVNVTIGCHRVKHVERMQLHLQHKVLINPFVSLLVK